MFLFRAFGTGPCTLLCCTSKQSMASIQLANVGVVVGPALPALVVVVVTSVLGKLTGPQAVSQALHAKLPFLLRREVLLLIGGGSGG